MIISVPKKVVPKAVQRNRWRRLIREVVRGNGFFDRDKLFVFKITRHFKGIKLENVRKEINELIGDLVD